MILRCALVLLAFLWPAHAAAQNFEVDSVDNPDLGKIAAGATGNTRFRANPAGGLVTKVSGTGVRVSSGTGHILVTVSCGNQGNCNNNNALVAIAQTGTPTNRANALQNFTVSTSGASATLATTPGTGNSISFEIGPVGRNSSKTFYVGYDFIVRGDNSGASTGVSSAGLSVTISRTNGNSPATGAGTVSASVFRTLNASASQPLSFGIISRPRDGPGLVSLAPGATSVVTSGDGVGALPGSSAQSAVVGVTGEGGQSVSVSVPTSFTMYGPGGSTIEVTPDPDISGSVSLSGSLGGAGSASVTIGGSFPLSTSTATGAYAGSFPVIFQYN
jgi:hypothetical protein